MDPAEQNFEAIADGDPVAGALANDASAGRVDTIRSYFVALNRRLTRTTRIGFDVSYDSRRSSSPAQRNRNYDGLAAGITTGYAF